MSTFEFNPFTGQFDVAGSGGGTPGGSDTQVQFNDGGSFGGDSGLTFNKTTNALTVGGATVTANAPVLDMSQTWNNAGVTFTGLKFNVTDTASAASSLLMDLQLGGSSNFSVGKNLIEKRNGTAAQTFRLYRTYTSGTDLAYTALKQDSTTGFILDSVNATAAEPTNLLDLQLNGSSKLKITKAGRIASAVGSWSIGVDNTYGISLYGNTYKVFLDGGGFGYSKATDEIPIVYTLPDTANTLAQRNGANAQESRVYGSYTSETNFQRLGIKTVRQSSGALSGATYTTTIAIPAYAHLIGVTTRVTTAVTGATSYDVGDGTDVDLWGAAIGAALGSDSDTANFTAVGAVGAAATSRTITLTANGGNFTGGVVEICAHYIFTEAD